MSKIGTWGRWILLSDGRIRRCRRANAKLIWESYPIKYYKHLDENDRTILVKKLNVKFELAERKARAEEQFDLENSIISPRILNLFDTESKKESSSVEYVKTLSSTLRKYVLVYFINVAKLPDPNHWPSNEAAWGQWLLKKKVSVSTIKKATQCANKLIRILHRENADLINLFQINPIGRAIIKEKKAESKIGKYISDEHWKDIECHISERIKPFVQLGYYYGLRRAETIAITEANLFEDCLAIERQIKLIGKKGIPSYSLLKNKEKRECPHWFITPEDAYKIILKIELINPDTLTHQFESEMVRLNYDYTFHDLRRTFITNALRVQHHRDVQLAVGHSDLRTTMQYAQDDRKLQRKPFKPSLKVVK